MILAYSDPASDPDSGARLGRNMCSDFGCSTRLVGTSTVRDMLGSRLLSTKFSTHVLRHLEIGRKYQSYST